MITDYLLELMGELHVPPKRRRRIVAEVEDHLQCSAAELHAEGLDVERAEQEAIRRFGPADVLARSFLEDEAALAGRAAGRAAVLLSAMLLLVAADPPGIVAWSRGTFPVGILSFVFGQIALVAGALTLVRIWRARSTRGPRGVRLALVIRGAAAVLAGGAVTLLCGVAALASAGYAPPLRSVIGLVALVATICAAARTLWLSWRRAGAAGIDRAAQPGIDEDALTDLAAVGSSVLRVLERRMPGTRRVRGVMDGWIEGFARRAPRLSSWFRLRRHPWRFTFVVALGAGLALAVGHGLGEGGPPRLDRLPMAVLAGALLTSIEAGAVLLGFLALGRFLGIRGASDGP